MNHAKNEVKLLIFTAMAPILWGTTYIITSEFLPVDRPILASIMRVLPIGMLVILIKQKLPKSNELVKILVLSFLNISCFQSLLFLSAYRLEGGIAAAIGSIQPLIILLLTVMIDKKMPNKMSFIALITTVFGMFLLLVRFDMRYSLDIIGCCAAFLGAISMAVGVYLTQKWKTDIDIMTFTGWQLLFGGLMLCPLFLVFETLPETITLPNILGYGYLAVFGSLFAYSLWFSGISKLPPVTVSILGVFSPITALFLGWIFLGQALTSVQLIGFFIVLICIIIIQIQSRVKSI